MVLDLCCGLGGWSSGFIAEGWQAVGVDLADFSKDYPGRFIKADLLAWNGWQELKPDLIVASPPCEEFSRHAMPWTRARNPPPPSMALWQRCWYIAGELGCPIILENVRGAQPWLGRSALNCGAFHLWGAVPAIIPDCVVRKKESYGSKERARRSKVPIDLSRWIAKAFATPSAF